MSRVQLSTKSFFGRRMTIDLAPLASFNKFWTLAQPNYGLWQAISNHYINLPYLDVPRGYYDITHEGFTVYHHNHDVTHAVRQRLYAKKYLEIISENGTIQSALIAKNIKEDPEINACLELAVFLCRAARTNEISSSKDQNNGKRSAELFTAIAVNLGFDQNLVKFLAYSIKTYLPNYNPSSDDELIQKLPDRCGDRVQLAKLLKGIIELSHDTDLVRCRNNPETINTPVERELKNFLAPHVNVKRAVTNMLLYAIDACKITGTRVKYTAYSSPQKNIPPLKKQHTENVSASIQQLETIEVDVHRICHEGVDGDFDELLRQLPLTKKLDLTNWEITKDQFKKLKKSIKNVEAITQACILGIKPDDMRKKITKLLKDKSRKQEKPIEIIMLQEVTSELHKDFNRQFRKQAFNVEASMRFSSRVGRAALNGNLMNQLNKERNGNIPRFGGKTDYTQVTQVRKLLNSDIDTRYKKLIQKTKVEKYSSRLLQEIQKQTISTDDSLQPGEMFLYHGTRPDTASSIMRDGFNTDKCRYFKANGFGPLGKGIYLSSELSKAATFSSCSVCGKMERCACMKPGSTYEPAERVMLLCRVFLGNPEFIMRKSDVQDRTQTSSGFNSSIGLSQAIEPISKFRSTEICIPNGAQIVPLYEIRFTVQANLLLPSQWRQTIAHNGLNSKRVNGIQNLLRSINLNLVELSKLREKNTNFLTVKNLAEKIEKDVNALIGKLQIPSSNPTSTKSAIQLRDVQRLKQQLITLQQETEDILKTKPLKLVDEKVRERYALVWKHSVVKIFAFKEYRLQYEAKTLANNIINSAKNPPEEFLSALIYWLNCTIERDHYKGHTFRVLGTRQYLAHRTVMTQGMIDLREKLRLLKEKKHEFSTEELAIEIRQLVTSAIHEINKNISSEPTGISNKIKRATSYITLSSLLLTAKKAEYSLVTQKSGEEWCSILLKKPKIYKCLTPENRKTIYNKLIVMPDKQERLLQLAQKSEAFKLKFAKEEKTQLGFTHEQSGRFDKLQDEAKQYLSPACHLLISTVIKRVNSWNQLDEGSKQETIKIIQNALRRAGGKFSKDQEPKVITTIVSKIESASYKKTVSGKGIYLDSYGWTARLFSCGSETLSVRSLTDAITEAMRPSLLSISMAPKI